MGNILYDNISNRLSLSQRLFGEKNTPTMTQLIVKCMSFPKKPLNHIFIIPEQQSYKSYVPASAS